MTAFRSRTFGDLADELAERKPGAFFGVDSDGDSATYGDFAHQTSCIAGWLSERGVGAGTRIALVMCNRLDWLRLATAAHKLGATVVPISTWSTAREVAHVLRAADATLVVSEARVRSNDLRAMFSHLADSEIDPDRLVFWEEVRLAALAHAPRTSQPLVRSSSTAFILFTSGSTAAPKGVLLAHGDAIENAFNIGERMHLTPEDRVYLAVPLFWSFGSINAWPALLSHGAGFALHTTFDARGGLELIEKERCTVFYGMANMAHALVEHPEFTPERTATLRTGLTIGLSHDLAFVADRLGVRDICNVYGMTETYGNCCVTDAAMPRERRFRVQGAPLPSVELRVTGEDGSILPAGMPGNIEVRGYTAHYTDPALDAAHHTPDGFFRTGDVGTLEPDGVLRYVARNYEMIKTGGMNVAPAEVEAILRGYDQVDQAYVVAVPDDRRDERVFAFIVPHEGDSQIDVAAVASYCRTHLATYKIPSQIEILSPDLVPLTPTGKVHRKRLRELAATRAAVPFQ